MSICLSVCLDHFQGNIVLAAMSVTADNLMRILRSSSVFLTPLTGEKLTAQRIWNSQFSILHRESATKGNLVHSELKLKIRGTRS